MRKLICSALMILCLVLTGCGSTKEQKFESARSRLTEAGISLTAQVQADFGETVEEYTLDYSYDGEIWTVLVREPEFVSGITARIGEDASELEYDGAILTTGDLTGSGIVPISAVPMVWETLETGTVDSVWFEENLLAAMLIYDDVISVTLWINEMYDPVAATLAEDGIVKATCTLTNIQIEEANHGTNDETDLGGDQSGESGT